MTERAFLGLGSNIEDRLAHLRDAVRMLREDEGIRVLRSSRVWETDPVGGPPQGDFLNAVIEVGFDGTPRELLASAHRVEAALGRVREVRWGPRTIDVDVLLIGDRTIDEPDLIVPHPRLTERAFVLLPLLELEPDLALPGGRRLVDFPLGPDAVAGARPFAPPLPTGP
ncbi:MAG TPA: 2-amino-4-hydroxy-6-hydroxymethyldihydropteridine diphosphokinase [Actinomycetota bacterium]